MILHWPVVMAISFDDYITAISFVISSLSLAIVIFLSYRLQNRPKVEHHNQGSSVEDREVEVSAIVSEFNQRLRKLEENLVDQRVKLEILELRVSRAQRELPPAGRSTTLGIREELPTNPVENLERPSMQRSSESSGTRDAPRNDRPEPDKKLGVTEIEALRLVFEGRGKISAKEIQQRIGRTREHTARMMNSLYHDGLVDRDVNSRPFSYSITEKGRDLLNG